jgi:hypothetical protein
VAADIGVHSKRSIDIPHHYSTTLVLRIRGRSLSTLRYSIRQLNFLQSLMSGALTLVVKNAIAVVIVHARVGQKLVKSTKLRVLRVANDKFWTLHLRLQTITDAILKPLVKILIQI